MNNQIIIEDWGLIDYRQALERQRMVVNEIIGGGLGRIVFCEHPKTLTLGRMTKDESMLFPIDEIKASGVEVYSIDRGGDVTAHEPGQMVVYVILNLAHYQKDLKRYMAGLQEVAVDLLREFGILAESYLDQRGVFVNGQKIVSIGVGVRKWVSYHGLGINVNNDLDVFRWVKPCGLDVKMTSMARQIGKPLDMEHVKKSCATLFKKKFEVGHE